jgi:hypothetical protein
MRCPDACGEIISVNLDGRAGPAWRLYRGKRGMTIFPSIWRESGCKSHFVVWDGHVYWAGSMDWEERESEADQPSAVEKVIEILRRAKGLVHFVDIADDLEMEPWATLAICKRLKRRKKVREGYGLDEGKFQLRN